MTISVLRADIQDAGATIDVGMRAFKHDALNRAILNLDTATPEQVAIYREYRIGMSTTRMSGPGKHYFKAVDDATGAIVGFTGMYAPEGFDINATWQAPTPAPTFINESATDEFRQRQVAAKSKWVGERKDVWYVQSMAVDPDHQGKGIGKLLLKRGLEEVDKADQDMYLEASAAAVQLYKSCGFEELEKMVLLDGQLVMTAMMRRRARS